MLNYCIDSTIFRIKNDFVSSRSQAFVDPVAFARVKQNIIDFLPIGQFSESDSIVKAIIVALPKFVPIWLQEETAPETESYCRKHGRGQRQIDLPVFWSRYVLAAISVFFMDFPELLFQTLKEKKSMRDHRAIDRSLTSLEGITLLC